MALKVVRQVTVILDRGDQTWAPIYATAWGVLEVEKEGWQMARRLISIHMSEQEANEALAHEILFARRT